MRSRRATAFSLVVGLALLACACQGRPPKVVFGVGMATNANPAVRQAVSEINASGGIGGVPLELVGLEDGRRAYSPEAIVEIAGRFAATPHLVGDIGHSDSAATLTAAPVYNRMGIPHVVSIATNRAITNIGPWTYRVCLSDAVQGPALADYAVLQWKKRRLAIVYVNDDYGRGLARLFEDRARSHGAQIVATAMHRNTLQPDDEQTIREAVRSIKREGADLVALFERVEAARWTLKAIREGGVQADVLGGEDLAQEDLPLLATVPTDGIRVSQFVNLDISDPRVAAFDSRMRAATGRRADGAQALAYDSVYLLRDAVLAGGYSREGVKAFLDRAIGEQRRFAGIGGPFTLGADHDARRPFHIAEIRAGLFQVIASFPVR